MTTVEDEFGTGADLATIREDATWRQLTREEGRAAIEALDGADAMAEALGRRVALLDRLHRGGRREHVPIDCSMCAVLDCPHSDPSHYEVEGCPTCRAEVGR